MAVDEKIDNLIIGAGPAGMATAMELWKENRSATVVEKNSVVGGLARTLEFKESDKTFRTDIGPHRFFSKNPYLYDFIEDILGEEWIRVERLTRFYIGGKYYLYPLRWRNALANIGILGVFRVLADFSWERLKEIISGKKKPKNFEEYAITTFGRSLAELNMLNYTEKIWGVKCNELSVDWAQQRIKGLTFWSAVKNAFSKKGSEGPKSLVDSFFYPSQGTGLIYEKIQQKVGDKTDFLLNSMPKSFRHDGSKVSEVVLETATGEQVVKPEKVVSSIPMTEVLDLFEPAVPSEVKQAAQNLRYRSQVYLFITVDKEQIFPDQWVYLPELEIPFGRVSEMKNFSKEMSPAGTTSIFIEFFCWEGDEIWNATTEELMEKTMPWMEKFDWFTKDQVRQAYSHRQAKVYPVYDLQYARNLKIIKEYLDSFSNLLSIGRPGRFKYNNQDHSLEMGIMAARSIVENKKVDFDSVGSESEYFEAGYTPAEEKK